MKKNPLLTKTGKQKLKPLSLSKLEELLGRTKPKDKNKIKNRIASLRKKGK